MQIELHRLKNAVKDIKEGWVSPNDSHTKAEYNGMCEGLDMLLKHFQEINEENKSISIEDRLDFIKDDIWDLHDKLTSICIKLNIEEDENA
tara:strand:- start:11680 stop:11952 length:273 start_codon:yes stop_codon:yes gene_type:complete